MTESEIKNEIKSINARLDYLKQFHANGDDSPYGYGTVANAKEELRYRKKRLQTIANDIKAEHERNWSQRRALRRIFDRDNNGIYPSDIGQDWRWRVENDTVYCVIDGKEFSEPIECPKQ